MSLTYLDLAASEKHKRLLDNLTEYAATAGIDQSWVYYSMNGTLPDDVIAWVRDYNMSKSSGLIIKAGDAADCPMVCAASLIVAAFLRNYIDARVMSIHALVSETKAGRYEDPTVLILSNFATGDTLAKWEITTVSSILIERQLKGKRTVLFAKSMTVISSLYGDNLAYILSGYSKSGMK